MSEPEMTTEAETAAFTDELSDEALDREETKSYGASWLFCRAGS